MTASALLLLCAAGSAMAGCAARPGAIAPVSMGNAYAGASCAEAAALRTSSAERLAILSRQQDQAATGDAIGVILIGVPMSSLAGGDVSGEIAAEKGRVAALDARLQGC